MLHLAKQLLDPLSHLFFPHLCRGCQTDLLSREHQLCSHCIAGLPYTHFASHIENPVERTFYGRAKLKAAMSLLYFTPSSITQHLVHGFKYKGQQELAKYLGKIMGRDMANSGRFNDIDTIIPLPLFKGRERSRGYNQAALLAEGVSAVTGIPMLPSALQREKPTETQTHRSREERWQNVNGQFAVSPGTDLHNRSILLVDDVITTGATLDACAALINRIPGTSLSIATLAYAMK